MSVTVSGSNPLSAYFDPTGALAQSKVDFSLRMEQASQAPTEALASFLTHHGFSDAPRSPRRFGPWLNAETKLRLREILGTPQAPRG